MSTLADIRNALAAQISASTTGVNVRNHMADNIAPPAVVIFRPEVVSFLESFTPTTKAYSIPLKLVVQRVDPETADNTLDDLLDQVCDAIASDPTLSGVVDCVEARTADQFGTVDVGDVTYLACDLHVEVIVS